MTEWLGDGATSCAKADSILEVNTTALEGVVGLSDLGPGDAFRLPLEQLVALKVWANQELLTPRVGAITAFIDGGFLADVEDVGLRTTVAGIPSILDELSEESIQLLDLGSEQTVAVAAATGPGLFVDLWSEGVVQESTDPAYLASFFDNLVRNVDFMTVMTAKSFVAQTYNRELSTVIDQLTSTRNEIQAALAAVR